VNRLEQAPPCAAQAGIVSGVPQPLNLAMDFLALATQRLEQGRQRTRFPGSNAVTPLFGLVENTLFPPIAAAERVQRGPDWLRVYVAHQLADELFLSPQRTMRAHRPGSEYGIPESLVQVDTIELFPAEPDQPFAERLKGQLLAFSRRFAGL